MKILKKIILISSFIFIFSIYNVNAEEYTTFIKPFYYKTETEYFNSAKCFLSRYTTSEDENRKIFSSYCFEKGSNYAFGIRPRDEYLYSDSYLRIQYKNYQNNSIYNYTKSENGTLTIAQNKLFELSSDPLNFYRVMNGYIISDFHSNCDVLNQIIFQLNFQSFVKYENDFMFTSFIYIPDLQFFNDRNNLNGFNFMHSDYDNINYNWFSPDFYTPNKIEMLNSELATYMSINSRHLVDTSYKWNILSKVQNWNVYPGKWFEDYPLKPSSDLMRNYYKFYKNSNLLASIETYSMIVPIRVTLNNFNYGFAYYIVNGAYLDDLNTNDISHMQLEINFLTDLIKQKKDSVVVKEWFEFEHLEIVNKKNTAPKGELVDYDDWNIINYNPFSEIDNITKGLIDFFDGIPIIGSLINIIVSLIYLIIQFFISIWLCVAQLPPLIMYCIYAICITIIFKIIKELIK